ncbi:hypothetical protein PG985_000175 [Apiospora marii]
MDSLARFKKTLKKYAKSSKTRKERKRAKFERRMFKQLQKDRFLLKYGDLFNYTFKWIIAQGKLQTGNVNKAWQLLVPFTQEQLQDLLGSERAAVASFFANGERGTRPKTPCLDGIAEACQSLNLSRPEVLEMFEKYAKRCQTAHGFRLDDYTNSGVIDIPRLRQEIAQRLANAQEERDAGLLTRRQLRLARRSIDNFERAYLANTGGQDHLTKLGKAAQQPMPSKHKKLVTGQSALSKSKPAPYTKGKWDDLK